MRRQKRRIELLGKDAAAVGASPKAKVAQLLVDYKAFICAVRSFINTKKEKKKNY